MAIGDALKAAVTKAGLDAARESAVALTAALQAADAAAAALNKRGPMTPQEAATAEVKRLAAEARKATSEYNAIARAQARMEASGARAAGQQAKAGARKTAQDEAKVVQERGAKMRKAVADAARMQRASKQKAEKEEEEKGGGGKSGAPKDLKYLLKHAGVGKAAMGAVGAAGGLELTKLALGQRGMAMLGAISQRTGFQIRQLFTGVNPMPVVKAADHFSQLFNKATATGGAISGVFTRVFNSLFGGVEKAEPLFFAFAEGMVGGALQIEVAYYKARLALMPFTDAIADMLPSIDGIEVAATAGGIAIMALGAYAAVASAPLIPLSIAIAAVVKALEQLAKLQKEISAAGGIGAAAKGMVDKFVDVGGSGSRAIGAQGRAGYDANEERLRRAREASAGGADAAPAGGAPASGAAGAATGKAYADGLAKGVAAGQPGVDAAGAAAGQGLDGATRRTLKVNSPSKVGEETGGQYPAGLAQGVEKRAPEAHDAMAKAAAPPPSTATQNVAAMGGAFPAEALALLRQIEANTRQRSASASRSGGWAQDVHTIASVLGVA